MCKFLFQEIRYIDQQTHQPGLAIPLRSIAGRLSHADDYRFYLETLIEWKTNLECRVHTYCLMTNHVHLVIDPGAQAEHPALLMKRVAGRYTRYINKKESRTGTVWEGRYKSSLIDKGGYLMACCRYVEMNPVRAGAVMCPEDYRWSSYRAKAGLVKEEWLDYDAFYMGLGKSEKHVRDATGNG